ncbi:NAD(P)H-dependent oxidoreductase [uncultured Aquimarina sp.]|uniref:NAD(P)H-dependent oxidoreductase n=1 Tax=uncultured Aquimarina sp. TaxID=575652 RepID=UPI00262EB16B|nr:NAD(P)H-dependent oxidoreductase [uncultured Aquimarina sp.]
MNVLIIYCHPSKESYTFQILKQLKESLKKESIEFQISDLYETYFQTEMTEQEYMREGLLNLDLPILPDVKIEQEKIENADCIVFLYPVWWSDCPAKLKGWFDRVYSVGYAYGYDNKVNKVQRMKTIKYGISLCRTGHPNKFLDEIGIAESMRNVMIDDRLGQRFKKRR